MNVVEPIRDAAKVKAIEADLKQRNARDHMLFVAGTQSGLRISDLLKLAVGDVEGPHLVIKETKTRKRKWIRVTPKLRREFRRYTRGMDEAEYLFASRQGGGKPICRARAYEIIKAAAHRHGIKHVGTHTLRKTFGYHFYKRTKDVALLQEIFSHSDPSITLRYIGVNQDIMDRAMQRFSIGD